MEDKRPTKSGCCFRFENTTILRLTGGDRQKWLHNFCTADIKALEQGQGCEAFILNVKGKTIAHAIILMSKFDLTVIVIGKPEIGLADHFNKYIISEDVQIEDIGLQQELWYASGPKLNSMFEKSIPVGQLYSHALVRDRSIAVATKICGRRDWLLLVNKTEDLAQWYGGVGTLNENQFHQLRFESRFPITGVDVTLDHLPQEFCRDENAISFEKGCYLGQETVARIDAIGHVNYFLVGLRFEKEVESAGIDIKRDDKVVGNVTSSAGSRGLGFIRRIYAKSGEVFETESGQVTLA